MGDRPFPLFFNYSRTRGLSSNGTENHAKAETPSIIELQPINKAHFGYGTDLNEIGS